MLVSRANTILYCEEFQACINFYREIMGFRVAHERDWFVEFQVGQSYVSVADAARTSLGPTRGRGLTLSLGVTDIHEASHDLIGLGADVGELKSRWGTLVFDLVDPEGHRIEVWQLPE